ncbi:MAG: FecR domain-containing protein [Agriterribacter sp.]
MEHFDDQFNKFLTDDAFIAWVTHQDKTLNDYWEQWMEAHPDEVTDLMHARELVARLSPSMPEAEIQKLSDAIWQHVDAHTQNDTIIQSSSQTIKKNKWFAIAASVSGLLLVSGIAYYFLANKTAEKIAQTTATIQNKQLDNTLSRTNTTAENKVVYLVDGSKVTLEPGASIKHITFLQKEKREIELEGNAFFEVAKDAKRPFYVYTNDIVLRVLGTSFNVSSGKNKGDVQVLVHTGKVSVTKRNNTKQENIILTPNQQMLYQAQTQTLTTSTFDGDLGSFKPKHDKENHLFNFEETPVTTIFSVMQQAYGIAIEYDEKGLANRKVTSYLGDESFEEKMEIICDAINAGYSIKNNKVIVEPK